MTIQLPNQEGEEIDQQQRLKGAWDPEARVCKMSKNRGPKMSSGGRVQRGRHRRNRGRL